MQNNPDHLKWRKAEASNNGQNGCIEAAPDGCGVRIRDSKNPFGPQLKFGNFSTFATFVDHWSGRNR